MEWLDEGIILSTRRHGDSSAVVSLFTENHGRHAGLARGARGSKSRGVYQQGNEASVTWRARLPEHLGSINCELKSAHAAKVIDDPLRLTALSSICALAYLSLPERHPYPDLYRKTLLFINDLHETMLWPMRLVIWELELLGDLGFGLDLSSCALTGQTHDLAYVSPRSGRAVSKDAGAPYRKKLLRLPSFALNYSEITELDAGEVFDGLKLTGWFISRHLLVDRSGTLPAARERLLDQWSEGSK
tara:strand:- start:43283 stop:44017 length:735 start_codon:yes stop_codon:yes gene_type:complete